MPVTTRKRTYRKKDKDVKEKEEPVFLNDEVCQEPVGEESNVGSSSTLSPIASNSKPVKPSMKKRKTSGD